MVETKKILFVGETPAHSKAVLARLCKISVERFDLLFDYTTLYVVATKFNLQDAHDRACDILRVSPHPFIVIVGNRVASAFIVKDMDWYRPFPLGFDEGDGTTNKQVRAAIKVIPDTKNPWYQNPANTRKAMLVVADLISVCGKQMEDSEIQECFKAVEGLGEDLNYWTKKIYAELKDRYTNGLVIDKIDLIELMQSYANDVAFKRKKELQDASL